MAERMNAFDEYLAAIGRRDKLRERWQDSRIMNDPKIEKQIRVCNDIIRSFNALPEIRRDMLRRRAATKSQRLVGTAVAALPLTPPRYQRN